LQEPDIQDVADYIGIVLAGATGRKKPRPILLFCGVHFMAETARLRTTKSSDPGSQGGVFIKRLLSPPLFKKFREEHPDHIVISYINCSAGIKALSDVICTSSNAVAIVNSFAPEQKIIFAPDKNLGAYINKVTGRNMLLWNGACMVHEIFSMEKISRLKVRHPEAKLIAHPECEEAVLKLADFIGSTTQLLKYTETDPSPAFIVATETGILHQMEKNSPGKKFIPAPPNNACACNDCRT
jgi:quinolinate synthase